MLKNTRIALTAMAKIAFSDTTARSLSAIGKTEGSAGTLLGLTSASAYFPALLTRISISALLCDSIPLE